MRHVRLGRTGLSVSRLCLGTMTFGLQCDEPASVAILDGSAAGGIASLAGIRFTLGNAAERYQERYWHEREFATVEALRPLAAVAGMSIAQMAVAWVLAHPAITAPIIGASRPEQLADAGRRRRGPCKRSQGAARRAHARVPLRRRSPMSVTRFEED